MKNMRYNKIMEREKGSRKEIPKGNDLMKKLTSKIIRTLCTISTIAIIPVAFIEIYEIISGTAAIAPHIRNLTDGIFWSLFAVSQLCSWYICKHKNTSATF